MPGGSYPLHFPKTENQFDLGGNRQSAQKWFSRSGVCRTFIEQENQGWFSISRRGNGSSGSLGSPPDCTVEIAGGCL